MSWIGPAAKNGAKLAVKYGPQAKIAWEKVGKPAGEAAAKQAQNQVQRRKAFAKAATVVEGEVLRQIHHGEPVWVVLSQHEPVDCCPPVDIDLAELLKDADMTAAVSSKDFEEKRVKARLERARRRRAER
jgi:hypothetical protein